MFKIQGGGKQTNKLSVKWSTS